MPNFPLLGDFTYTSQNASLNKFPYIYSINLYKNGGKYGS